MSGMFRRSRQIRACSLPVSLPPTPSLFFHFKFHLQLASRAATKPVSGAFYSILSVFGSYFDSLLTADGLGSCLPRPDRLKSLRRSHGNGVRTRGSHTDWWVLFTTPHDLPLKVDYVSVGMVVRRVPWNGRHPTPCMCLRLSSAIAIEVHLQWLPSTVPSAGYRPTVQPYPDIQCRRRRVSASCQALPG